MWEGYSIITDNIADCYCLNKPCQNAYLTHVKCIYQEFFFKTNVWWEAVSYCWNHNIEKIHIPNVTKHINSDELVYYRFLLGPISSTFHAGDSCPGASLKIFYGILVHPTIGSFQIIGQLIFLELRISDSECNLTVGKNAQKVFAEQFWPIAMITDRVFVLGHIDNRLVYWYTCIRYPNFHVMPPRLKLGRKKRLSPTANNNPPTARLTQTGGFRVYDAVKI